MIHDAATGFAQVAGSYDRSRPEYPPEAVRWLFEALEVGAGSRVADIGAGTGRLTRHLVAADASVTAVEPVPEMRRLLERRLPAVRTSSTTAEELELDRGSLDAVLAGQAFHWFATERALRGFRRVLRPGGRLGLIWNRRRLEQPLQARISELIEPYRKDAPRHDSGHWRQSLLQTRLFEPVGEREVEFAQPLDAQGLIDRVASTSFIARLGSAERAELLARVGKLAATHSPLELEYVAEAFAFRRRD